MAFLQGGSAVGPGFPALANDFLEIGVKALSGAVAAGEAAVGGGLGI